jgi:hypothetical protein
MNSDWSSSLTRWTEAGLIDAEAADRIRAFELSQAGSGRLRWPILIALAFGALMIGGGVLLFVAANWQALSPAQRFALVLLPRLGVPRRRSGDRHAIPRDVRRASRDGNGVCPWIPIRRCAAAT